MICSAVSGFIDFTLHLAGLGSYTARCNARWGQFRQPRVVAQPPHEKLATARGPSPFGAGTTEGRTGRATPTR